MNFRTWIRDNCFTYGYVPCVVFLGWLVDNQMHGYFNFTKAAGKSKIFSNYITLKDYAIKKKGKTKFGVPVFEVGQEVTEVEDKALRQLTDEYDNYLKYYHSKKEETVAANTTDEDDFTN